MDSTTGTTLLHRPAPTLDGAGIGPIGRRPPADRRDAARTTVESAGDAGFAPGSRDQRAPEGVVPAGAGRQPACGPATPTTSRSSSTTSCVDTGIAAAFRCPARRRSSVVVAHTPTGRPAAGFPVQRHGRQRHAEPGRRVHRHSHLRPGASDARFDITWRVGARHGRAGRARADRAAAPRRRLRAAIDRPARPGRRVHVLDHAARGSMRALARSQSAQEPYVVPNPYVGAASFEPERFAVSVAANGASSSASIPHGARDPHLHGRAVNWCRRCTRTARSRDTCPGTCARRTISNVAPRPVHLPRRGARRRHAHRQVRDHQVKGGAR